MQLGLGPPRHCVSLCQCLLFQGKVKLAESETLVFGFLARIGALVIHECQLKQEPCQCCNCRPVLAASLQTLSQGEAGGKQIPALGCLASELGGLASRLEHRRSE
eukprot:2295127-Alexandrium_andersonii.AAC.1